mmetsp:Transcript_64898/g.163518  ORF Transcript_64898/g.163518 Transcript_64898/m.163518 type:complete len:330 (+) Transcript_64898:1962-2951(+)
MSSSFKCVRTTVLSAAASQPLPLPNSSNTFSAASASLSASSGFSFANCHSPRHLSSIPSNFFTPSSRHSAKACFPYLAVSSGASKYEYVTARLCSAFASPFVSWIERNSGRASLAAWIARSSSCLESCFVPFVIRALTNPNRAMPSIFASLSSAKSSLACIAALIASSRFAFPKLFEVISATESNMAASPRFAPDVRKASSSCEAKSRASCCAGEGGSSRSAIELTTKRRESASAPLSPTSRKSASASLAFARAVAMSSSLRLCSAAEKSIAASLALGPCAPSPARALYLAARLSHRNEPPLSDRPEEEAEGGANMAGSPGGGPGEDRQ